MHTRILLCAMVPALTLARCAAPGPFDDALDLRPVTVPPPATVPVDTRPEALESLTSRDALDVEQLVSLVLRRNPSLSAMAQAWRAATERYPQVTSLEDPMLRYGLAPGTLGRRDLDAGQEIGLSQRLPWPGKRPLRGRIAQREADAAAHDFEAMRQQLAQETREAFYDYYLVHRALEINEVNLGLLREFERIAQAKYAAATASKQDALAAQVERWHLEHLMLTLRRDRGIAAARINTLLHRPADAHLPPPPTSLDLTDTPTDLSALTTRAVNIHPELQSLAQRLAARRDERLLARLEYKPDFTVMGLYSSMWDMEEHRWMIGGEMNLPIQTDRRRAAELEALAEVHRAAAELAAGVDRVAFEVNKQVENIHEARHVALLYRDTIIPATTENLDAALAGYQSGANDFLTLLMAEKNLMTARLELEQALAQFHQRRAELQRAVGGFPDTTDTTQEHSHE